MKHLRVAVAVLKLVVVVAMVMGSTWMDLGGCDVGGQGAGGAGGFGKHECGWVKVSSGGLVSWQVDGGMVD